MQKFAALQLKLNKGVKKGSQESLLSLFSASERFKHIQVLADADEKTSVRVVLEGLGEVNLKLGADMDKGRRKTIMTLFWYSERSKDFEIERDAAAGEDIFINMYL
jgi:hypothetical protein